MVYKFKTTVKAPGVRADKICSNMKIPGAFKTRYLSIDQSLSCTGVLAADYKLNIKRAVTIPTFPENFPESRINTIGMVMDGILKIEGTYLKFVALEMPAFAACGLRDILHGVYWEIRRRVWLYNPELEIITAPIGTWKKFSCGHGRADKKMIQREIEARYDKHFHDENLYDAYGILRWAVHKYQKDQKKRGKNVKRKRKG